MLAPAGALLGYYTLLQHADFFLFHSSDGMPTKIVIRLILQEQVHLVMSRLACATRLQKTVKGIGIGEAWERYFTGHQYISMGTFFLSLL
ncbi:hypothetical protein B7P43_G07164 [Cryptotermes secundus]|uniref:Uncharacterized protein n=1 Tax=Cryptotermes secundus TaxID=105785 RepID=A0A2J7PJR4_9NEOP|nr:hypothetical protein B7P43_G07164 [Cryptotermes secundus]